ncbi:hypothetical protein [Streptomyces sp. NRRL F-5123]|uniref:hypothetical protein n=1 Tax=Streptomyces sp. NRRL F-5123 TaxID=1463856 RepID=UPI000694378C|nr:hypothetical protein [Streptomyces sp. NRRL F-5123]
MTATPGADEHRIRHALHRRGVGYAPQPPARDRDWFDDYVDATTQPRTPPPGPPPDRATAQAADGPEPRWDLRRLTHWPYARPTIGAATALIPWWGGWSAATRWGAILTQARHEAGVSAAWVIACTGLTVGAVLVHRRRGWPSYALLTSAFVGTVAMASPLDIVRFVTGAF